MTKTAKDFGMKPVAKKPAKRGNMGVYSSLVTNQTKKLASSVKAAKGKASEMMTKRSSGKSSDGSKKLRPLPKEQPARFFAHFRWERIKAYWFSKAGLKRVGKIFVRDYCGRGIICLLQEPIKRNSTKRFDNLGNRQYLSRSKRCGALGRQRRCGLSVGC